MNDIETKIFYLTSFLLNYDISKIIVNTDEDINKSYLIEKILEMILSNNNYPQELLMNKFFEFAKWININLDELCDIVINKIEQNPKNITDDELKKIKKNMQDYFNFLNFKDINFKKYSHNELYDIYINMIKKKIIDTTYMIKHTGQPLPDPILGRPKLDWCKCSYKNCSQLFKTPIELTNHLIKNNVYTKGYHMSHEESVKSNDLTILKVCKNKIKKCPSWICKTKDFDSPEELINHLQVLGIKPFWHEGLIINNDDNDNNNVIKLLEEKNKIFNTKYCLMCLEDSANILINKCCHQVYCIHCVGELLKKSESLKLNCPICRGKIDNFYPYA